EYKTKNYDLKTNVSASEAKAVKGFLEAMHRTYKKVFPDKAVRENGRAKVIAFQTKQGYAAWSRKNNSSFNENTMGYFFRDKNTLVVHRGRNLEELFGILSHEGFHQFAWSYIVPKGCDPLPIWFEEGLAEYFRSGKVKKGRLQKVDLDYHFRSVKDAISRKWIWSLKQIWFSNPNTFKDASVFNAFYAHAYVFMEFLVEHAQKMVKKVYKLKREGKSSEDIMNEVFPEKKRGKLYKGFLQYTQKHK
ncbi:MAG: DUF1570 domain-containing protein, partial [Planctomycetota bacterium]|nr:DUF1570 domain-containing protein [Planctomycetota bacterium]